MSLRFTTNAWFVVVLASACTGAVDEPLSEVPPSSAMNGTPVTAQPAQEVATTAVAGVQPSIPAQAMPPSATIPAQAPTPTGTSGAAQAATPGAMPAPAPSIEAPAPEFDAGSGMMQADGTTVVYHIPDGTGGGDWNPMDKPIRVRRGMTIRFIDDDTTKEHQLHTSGQPCAHGFTPIGDGFDCAIRDNASIGLANGVFDHNGAGGRGRVFIEVVQ